MPRASAARSAQLRCCAALLLLAAPPAVAAAPPAGVAGDPCRPLQADPPAFPDLQQLLHRACRAVAGEARPRDGDLASRLRVIVGGWTDVGYLDDDRHDRGASFDLDHANLHLDVRLDDRVQLFAEAEYEHERDASGRRDDRKLEVEQAYAQYALSDGLKLRAGKFATPFGYWTPVHWSVNVDTIEAPIHEESRMVPEQQLGGRVHGRLFPGWARSLEASVEYSLALGYGANGLDTGKPEGLTAGADLRLWSSERHLLGASYFTQENSEVMDRAEHDLVLYGQLGLPADLLVRTEYLHQWRESRSGFTRDADVVYAKVRWDFHRRAYLNYRYQFGQDDGFGITAHHSIHTVTLGLRPWPRVIGKLETAFHDLDRHIESYVSWGASLGLLF